MQGLGNEQMNVLGHDDVTDELEPVLCSDLTENLNKGVTGARRAEERKTPVATERDEVQVAETVDALETFRHDNGTKKPHASPTRRMGHPQQHTLRLSSAMVSCAQISKRGANDSKHRSLGHPPTSVQVTA